MRKERDFIGEQMLPDNALYGIHALRARENFPSRDAFPIRWYQAIGTVKQACYRSIGKLRSALATERPELIEHLRIPDQSILEAMDNAAGQIAQGKHIEHFIVPGNQGGAGTSINLNINEIISNLSLISLGEKPGTYSLVDPLESANLFQSTNDVIPTALTLASMRLYNELEESINHSRACLEKMESKYRNTLRLAYTQMEEALPSTYGQLFASYAEALSRDWWRVSKAFERIKMVNLGGGATGTALSIPRFYVMEVVRELNQISSLPLAQAENMHEATMNLDKWVEVHAILKAHAVNIEKMASDLRLLGSGIAGSREISLPDQQVGSSIMPGKVNPVVAEYLIASAHQIYANDSLITALVASGCLELNAYLPQIGTAMLESLELMISMNRAFLDKMLSGIEVDEDAAREKVFRSPAICTALSPYTGYYKSSELAKVMKAKNLDIFAANKEVKLMDEQMLRKLMEPGNLLKKGFSVKDIGDLQ